MNSTKRLSELRLSCRLLERGERFDSGRRILKRIHAAVQRTAHAYVASLEQEAHADGCLDRQRENAPPGHPYYRVPRLEGEIPYHVADAFFPGRRGLMSRLECTSRLYNVPCQGNGTAIHFRALASMYESSGLCQACQDVGSDLDHAGDATGGRDGEPLQTSKGGE